MYTFITQYNSPNYTTAGDAKSVWGRPRTIEAIAGHWWDDPLNKPSFEGVINTLCNPQRQASAHFVLTGTGRRVACLVNLEDASWATNSANPYTISIEADPRCRDEDYDVYGELVAELWATYGEIKLIRHSDVIATRCPGNYDLNRVQAIARTKLARKEDQFGMATNKPGVPVPAPTPVPPVPVTPVGYRVYVNGVQVGAYSLPFNAYNKYITTGRVGVIKDATGVDVTIAVVSRYEPIVVPPVVVPAPLPSAEDKLQNDRIGAIEKRVGIIESFLKLLSDLFAKWGK